MSMCTIEGDCAGDVDWTPASDEYEPCAVWEECSYCGLQIPTGELRRRIAWSTLDEDGAECGGETGRALVDQILCLFCDAHFAESDISVVITNATDFAEAVCINLANMSEEELRAEVDKIASWRPEYRAEWDKRFPDINAEILLILENNRGVRTGE